MFGKAKNWEIKVRNATAEDGEGYTDNHKKAGYLWFSELWGHVLTVDALAIKYGKLPREILNETAITILTFSIKDSHEQKCAKNYSEITANK